MQKHNNPVVNSPTVLPLEVDPQATAGSESAYGEELSSYSTSLMSSVKKYRLENGRRYHAYEDGKYMLPNDKTESDRLDMHHELCRQILEGKLFLAPVENPQRVLDLGTGTGIWAIEFAEQHSSAQVIGCDLSPIQPQWVPPNAQFYVDDIEKEWTYDRPFDFIHARYLALAMKDYRGLVKQAYRNARPGSWVEFQDWDQYGHSEDGSIEGTSLDQYFQQVIGSFAKQGYEASPGPKLEQYFKDAGFQDIHVEKFRAPLGTWPKDKHYKTIGAWAMLQGEPGYEAGAMAVLTRYEGWSKEEVGILVAKTKADVRNPKIHALVNFYVVYGRKPE